MAEEAKNIVQEKDWFGDVLEKKSAGRGRGGHSAMGDFKKVLKEVLIKTADPSNRARVTLADGRPAIRAGNIANSLKVLFTNIEDEQKQYGRAYRYLRGMADVLKKWGWEYGDYDDAKHIILIDPEKFQKFVSTGSTEEAAPVASKKPEQAPKPPKADIAKPSDMA